MTSKNDMDTRMDYLKSSVSPILEPLVLEILAQRPPNPLEFMIEWLTKKRGQGNNANSSRPCEEEKKNNNNKINKKKNEVTTDEEDDVIDDLPIVKHKTGITRKAVSAEAYGAWNKKENFVARVIPKTEEQKARILNKLHTSFIFSALDRKELDIVVAAMEEKGFHADDVVIKQGDEGDNLYVVESGNLICTKRFASDQEPKFLKEYQPGEAFGELALLYNAPRAANIIAKTECVLWSLDRATFNHIVKDAAIKKRERYEEFLKSVEILAVMDPYELTVIADAVKPAEFKAGEYIIKEGEQGDKFYLLEEGEAFAMKKLEQGKEAKKVMEYKKGSYFGELALLYNAPRAASVVAKTDCVCLSLDSNTFKRIMGTLKDMLVSNAKNYEGNILSR